MNLDQPWWLSGWVFEGLQIQVAESHRSQVQILLGTHKLILFPRDYIFRGCLEAARKKNKAVLPQKLLSFKH